MSDKLTLLTIRPPSSSATRGDAIARGLVEIGLYETTAPNTYRLTEEGFEWMVFWLPRVIGVLIARGRTPEMNRLVELEWENLDLRVQVEELKRGILSPHRATQTGDEEE